MKQQQASPFNDDGTLQNNSRGPQDQQRRKEPPNAPRTVKIFAQDFITSPTAAANARYSQGSGDALYQDASCASIGPSSSNHAGTLGDYQPVKVHPAHHWASEHPELHTEDSDCVRLSWDLPLDQGGFNPHGDDAAAIAADLNSHEELSPLASPSRGQQQARVVSIAPGPSAMAPPADPAEEARIQTLTKTAVQMTIGLQKLAQEHLELQQWYAGIQQEHSKEVQQLHSAIGQVTRRTAYCRVLHAMWRGL